MKTRIALVLLLTFVVLSAGAATRLGSIDFPNSGAPAAQEAFTHAVRESSPHSTKAIAAR